VTALRTRPDISVIITAHREGLLACPTIRSAVQAAVQARSRGLVVESLAVLDRPDQDTIEVFKHLGAGFRLIETMAGDPGFARNAGVAAATGNWIAFLDADDLWGGNWLTDAHVAAVADPRLVVWHPEINLYFGACDRIFHHLDMDDRDVDLTTLMLSNFWTALSFTPRRLLLKIPFEATDRDNQIGFEDWSWNMRAIAAGAIHKIVPGTGHLIRAKLDQASVVQSTLALRSLPHSTPLFRSILEQRAEKMGIDRKTDSVGI
jgi:glycosyltransferase involved in cell wall biosynthesis